jgi:hypothetical protein
MRRRIGGVLMLAMTAGLGLSAAGQVTVVRQRPVGAPARVAQQPYSAEFKITRVQTLADGSTLTHETTEVVARDAQGRWMSSSTATPLSEDQTPRTNVNVNDPVARTHSFWLVPGQKATVTNMPEPGTSHTSCAAPVVGAVSQTPGGQRIKPTFEELGTQTIQGVEARGRRVTHTYPAGSIGNSEELVRSDETWFSIAPGLNGILVRQINDDAQMGKTTREMVKFTPGDPDPASFQPPADYEVVTQETRDEVRCP